MNDLDITVNPSDVVLDLSDVLIEDEGEYPFTFFPTGLVGSAEIIHNRTQSKGKIKSYDPSFAYLTVDWGDNEHGLYDQIRIDRPEVDGFSICLPSSELDESLDVELDGRGWILKGGRIVSTYNGPHWERRHLVKGKENVIRYNFGYERYVDLPKERPDDAQLKTLSKLMDYFFVSGSDVGIRKNPVEICIDSKDKRFPISPNEYTVDEAMDFIKRLYVMEEAVGPLCEDAAEPELDVVVNAQNVSHEYMDEIERKLMEAGYTDIEFRTEVLRSKSIAEWYHDKDVLKLTFNGRVHKGIEMLVDGDGWGVHIIDKANNDHEYRSMEELTDAFGIDTDDEYFYFRDKGERDGTLDCEQTYCYLSVYYKDAGLQQYEYFDTTEDCLWSIDELIYFLLSTEWIDSYLSDNLTESLDVVVKDPKGDSDSYMKETKDKLEASGFVDIEFHKKLYRNRQNGIWYAEEDVPITGTKVLTGKYPVEGVGVVDVEIVCGGYLDIRRSGEDSLYNVEQLEQVGIMNDDDLDDLLNTEGVSDYGDESMFDVWISTVDEKNFKTVSSCLAFIGRFDDVVGYLTNEKPNLGLDDGDFKSEAERFLLNHRITESVQESLDVSLNPKDVGITTEEAVKQLESHGFSVTKVFKHISPYRQHAEFYADSNSTEVILEGIYSVEDAGNVYFKIISNPNQLWIKTPNKTIYQTQDLIDSGIEDDYELSDFLSRPGVDYKLDCEFCLSVSVKMFDGRMKHLPMPLMRNNRFDSFMKKMLSEETMENIRELVLNYSDANSIKEALDVVITPLANSSDSGYVKLLNDAGFFDVEFHTEIDPLKQNALWYIGTKTTDSGIMTAKYIQDDCEIDVNVKVIGYLYIERNDPDVGDILWINQLEEMGIFDDAGLAEERYHDAGVEFRVVLSHPAPPNAVSSAPITYAVNDCIEFRDTMRWLTGEGMKRAAERFIREIIPSVPTHEIDESLDVTLNDIPNDTSSKEYTEKLRKRLEDCGYSNIEFHTMFSPDRIDSIWCAKSNSDDYDDGVLISFEYDGCVIEVTSGGDLWWESPEDEDVMQTVADLENHGAYDDSDLNDFSDWVQRETPAFRYSATTSNAEGTNTETMYDIGFDSFWDLGSLFDNICDVDNVKELCEYTRRFMGD